MRFGAALVGCMVAWGQSSFAQTHIGLDATVATSVSMEGSRDTGAGSSTYVQKSTRFGIPAAASATLGAMLGDHVDLGARLGFSTETSKQGSDSSAPEATLRTLLVSPYLAYVGGEPDARTRFLFGLTTGFGSANLSAEATGGGASSETTVTLIQYGALLGLRSFVLDQVSLDPTLLLTRSTGTGTFAGLDEDVSLSGLALSLNLGLSFWIGRHPTSPTAVSTEGGTPAPVASDEPSAAVSTEPEQSSSPIRISGKSASVALTLVEGKVVNLTTNLASADQTTKLLLRDPDLSEKDLACQAAVIHAPNHEDVSVELSTVNLNTPSGPAPVLKAELPLESLRILVDSPHHQPTMVPEHWIDVCGRHWYVPESSRDSLREYFKRVRSRRVKVAPTPEAVPTTEEPSSATPDSHTDSAATE